MSLQARIVALVGAVLLVSIVLGVLFAGYEARRALQEEVQAGMRGGAQTIGRAFGDLPRSNQRERDLQQLVATFDGNRHVAATLVDRAGRVWARSRVSDFGRAAPGWFRRVIAPAPEALTFPAPAGAGGYRAVRLSAVPDADLEAAWAELSSVVAVLCVSTMAGLILVSLVISATLAPLRELSARLAQVGQGDYRSRVPERGPSEILRLEQSFNTMAERLDAVGRRNHALEQQLLTLQDEERADLARDLHDDIGPQLFAVSLDAQMITQLVRAGRPEEVHGQVEAIQAAVGHVQREIRGMLARLRPARAAELGLERAIDDLIDFWRSRRPEIEFSLSLPPGEPEVAAGLKDTAFRVVQEAISNAVRHARPARIGVELRSGGEALVVRVTNDGAASGQAAGGTGFGLIGMRERVHSVGGELTVQPPAPAHVDWTVTARLPVASGPAPAKLS